jgi:hypothetical protein
VWALILKPFAFLRGSIHCLFRHGSGGPVRDVHHGQAMLLCPVCMRVFWRAPVKV